MKIFGSYYEDSTICAELVLLVRLTLELDSVRKISLKAEPAAVCSCRRRLTGLVCSKFARLAADYWFPKAADSSIQGSFNPCKAA